MAKKNNYTHYGRDVQSGEASEAVPHLATRGVKGDLKTK